MKIDYLLMQLFLRFISLSRVSPDYSVVAQKPAEQDIISRFETVFSKEYGITLGHIASFYNEQIHGIKKTADETQQQIEALTQKMQALLSSTSWKITAPLRKGVNLLKKYVL